MGLQLGYVYSALVTCLSAAGHFPEAERVLADLRSIGDSERAWRDEGELRFAQGAMGASKSCFTNLCASSQPAWRLRGYLYCGLVCVEADRNGEAADFFESGLRQAMCSGCESELANLRIARAWAAWRLGDGASLIENVKTGLELDSGFSMLAYAGTLYARVGAVSQAKAMLARARKYASVRAMQIAAHQIQGELFLQSGRSTNALEEFRSTATLEPALGYRNSYERALAAAGHHDESRVEYKRTADHPMVMWLLPLQYPPGDWLDAKRQLSSQVITN